MANEDGNRLEFLPFQSLDKQNLGNNLILSIFDCKAWRVSSPRAPALYRASGRRTPGSTAQARPLRSPRGRGGASQAGLLALGGPRTRGRSRLRPAILQPWFLELGRSSLRRLALSAKCREKLGPHARGSAGARQGGTAGKGRSRPQEKACGGAGAWSPRAGFSVV